MLIDLRGTGVTGKELQRRLDEVYITANKNAIPNDPESPFVTSGQRIGTPAVTTRGFGKLSLSGRQRPISTTRLTRSAATYARSAPVSRSTKKKTDIFLPVFATNHRIKDRFFI